ncbi:MAG TPA: hypothetical protein VI357_08600 [Mycobacteriales bacterium]
MAGEQWRGFVNGVLYMVQFEPTLDDDRVVAERAGRLVAQPLFDRPVGDTVDGLRAALASGEQLTGAIPQPHDEAAVRTFLGRLADRLEALRPWPAQPYRKLPVHSHADVLAGPVVARLSYDWKQAADRLHRGIERADDRAVLVLQLETGDVVAVVDDWDITPAGHRDGQSALVSGSARPPAEVIDAFRAATGFTAEEVTPV